MDAARLLELLELTARLPTAPYHEGEVIAHAERWAAENKIRVHRDRAGNVVLQTAPDAAAGPRVAFGAHMDHPGFEITDTSGALIQARWMGGVEPEYFAGAKVRVFSDPPATGMCVRTELHPERRRVDIMHLDLEPADAARVGDHGTWHVTEWELAGPLVHTRAADDLAGCAAVLGALSVLAAEGTPAWGLLTRAEEVGFHGALAAMQPPTPSLPAGVPVVTLEASHAKGIGKVRQGDGPVIRIGDREGVFDAGLCRLLTDTAASIRDRHSDFVYQRALMDGGACESTPYALHGRPSAGIALPLGNYHNRADSGGHALAAETIHVGDFFGAVTLMVEVARRVADAADSPAAALVRQREELTSRAREGMARLMSDGLAGAD